MKKLSKAEERRLEDRLGRKIDVAKALAKRIDGKFKRRDALRRSHDKLQSELKKLIKKEVGLGLEIDQLARKLGWKK